MYWNNIGNDVSSIYDKFNNNKHSTNKEKLKALDKTFSNFIKKIKKNDDSNITSFIKTRDQNNKEFSIGNVSKSIRKQLIRYINKSVLDDNYIIFPVSDYSFGINNVNDMSIKFVILLNDNINNMISISNILGLYGFDFYGSENSYYEFRKNIKKFHVKIFVKFSDDKDNNPYYLVHKSFSEKINYINEITFIKNNIAQFSKQNEILFNIILYNYVLYKSNKNFIFALGDHNKF
jgi:hypothetical protein